MRCAEYGTSHLCFNFTIMLPYLPKNGGSAMRKALLFILAAGCIIGSYATDARVSSMGKHDAFFMDETSVFRNPANINMYPNMVYGSYGEFQEKNSESTLANPFFGSIISFSLNETDDAGQYPMLSLGAVVNRYDEMLEYVNMGSDKYIAGTDTLVSPIGKVDLLLGYVLKNGVMLGGGAYIASQSIEKDNEISETKIYKGNLGMNWPVAKTMDLELSLGIGTMTAIDKNAIIAEQDYFGRVEARLFSALAGINGDFVPRARVDILSLEKRNELQVDIAAGLGVNINIDKGFFWSGLEFLYGQKDSDEEESMQDVGGRISFGIERNIIWDWFVIRVGGQKSILVNAKGAEEI